MGATGTAREGSARETTAATMMTEERMTVACLGEKRGVQTEKRVEEDQGTVVKERNGKLWSSVNAQFKHDSQKITHQPVLGSDAK